MQQEVEKVSIGWMDEAKTIIYCKVYDWDWRDLNRIGQEGLAMQNTVLHGTYSIFDLTESRRTVPQGAIRHLRDLVDTAHPNDLMIIVVGASELIKTLINIVGRVYKQTELISTYRFVDTMEQAFALIEAHRAEYADQTLGS